MSSIIKNKHIPASCQLMGDLDAVGASRETVDITRALVKAGGETVVMSRGGRLLPDMLRSGARHILIDIRRRTPLKDWANAWKIARTMKKNNARILHVRASGATGVATMVRRFRPIRLIATVHELDGKSPRDSRRLHTALEKCDDLVAVSQFMAAKIREIGIDASKITLIPRGIDMAKFDPEAVKTRRLVDLARKWRLPDGPPLILVPSTLRQQGGQAFLIETLSTMKDLDFTCLLLGDEAINPAHRLELEKRIVKLGLDEHVRFAGFCDDMPAAYKLADVVVSAALTPPPFDRVAVETQAMGRPLVVADHGATREITVPGITALPFAPGDADSLEKMLRKALAMSAEKRAAMGKAARDHVTARYTLDHICAGTIDLYTCEDETEIKS